MSDIHDLYDAIPRVLELYQKGKPQPWEVVPISRVKRIWADYAKTGVIRDEKGMQRITDLVLGNIEKAHANTVLAGHTSMACTEYFCDYLGIIWEDDSLFSPGYDNSEVSEFFESWCETIEDEDGAARLSDYVFDKGMIDEYLKLGRASTAEEQHAIIDRIFNLIHQRSDISAWFVEGGSYALSELASMHVSVIHPNTPKYALGRMELTA